MNPGFSSFKIVIRCVDVLRSRDFYMRILDFSLVEEWQEPGGQGCILAAPGIPSQCRLEAYQMNSADPRFAEAFTRPVAGDKIDLQLQTDSVDAWRKRLTGVWPFEGPEVLPWGQRWIKLRDPDHLLIAIYQEITL